MALSESILSQFAKMNVSTEKNTEGTLVTGTAVKYGDSTYVRLDGSDRLTPIQSSTASYQEGDRVSVLIKNHSATVTGNVTDPSAGLKSVDSVTGEVSELGKKVSEFDVVIADRVTTEQLTAEVARLDTVYAKSVDVTEQLTAVDADISSLKTKDAEITGTLEAANADIDNIKTNYITSSVVESTYATITNLTATDATVNNLKSTYADFESATANNFEAVNADISSLQANKADISSLNATYANIDFSNIGTAAIEEFFSKSGMISDLVVSDQSVTGTLVGVTITGDLIKGGTVVADKLVVKGEDGIFYKLNTDGVTTSAEQTDENSLNGSVITAKSITAEKVNVDDLVAFGATIGGFQIDEDSIHTVAKDAIDADVIPGVYFDNDGQFSVGDDNTYLKFFKDTDGKWKLVISASSMMFAASSKNVEDALDEATTTANNAQATADSKRRVFTDIPEPPYDIGDLWSQGPTGEMMVCATAKGVDDEYSEADWINSSMYTDSTIANDALNKVNDLTFTVDNELRSDIETAKNVADSASEDAQTALDSAQSAQGTAETAQKSIDSLSNDIKARIQFGVEDDSPIMTFSSSSDGLQTKITNKKISFIDNGNEVAYVSGQKFNMVDASAQTLQIGKFLWETRSNGNLSLKYVE
jgi:hypothetical protein